MSVVLIVGDRRTEAVRVLLTLAEAAVVAGVTRRELHALKRRSLRAPTETSLPLVRVGSRWKVDASEWSQRLLREGNLYGVEIIRPWAEGWLTLHTAAGPDDRPEDPFLKHPVVVPPASGGSL